MAPDASTSPVEWGPEIRVDGKRPEWLADDQVLQYHDGHSWYGDSPNYRWTAYKVGNQQKVHPGDHDDWPNATAIRLPADHPHYRQPTTPELDPALWDRMVALVQRMASGMEGSTTFPSLSSMGDYIEARAIVADLPKPVDPDLIEAREIAASMLEVAQGGTHIEETRRGERDGYVHVCIALAGIQRGRQLSGEQS